MGDNDQRAAIRYPCDVAVHDGFAVGVKRTRGLVENENGWIDDQRSRDRKALPLPSGKIGRSFIDTGFITARQFVDELLGARQTRRLDDVIKSGVRHGRTNVLAYRSAKKKILLQNDADVPA